MITAFDEVFREVARTESRAIDAIDHAGHRTRFFFRELYCADPRCDCRRALIQVIAVEPPGIAATIGYAFEAPPGNREAQLELDPFNPQGPRARALLDLFADLIEQDRGYRASLVRHYEMMKRSPEAAARAAAGAAGAKATTTGRKATGASARGAKAATGDAAAAKAKTKTKTKATAGAGAAGAKANAAGAQAIERVAAKAGGGESKVQKAFRRLLAKVDGLKQRVRGWQARRPDILGELARGEAAQARLGPPLREMVMLLDRAYGHPTLSKKDRAFLAETIASIAGELIEGGAHDDLKPLYNRYTRGDFDAEAAVDDAAAARQIRAMFEEMGVDFGDADVSTVEKLNAHAAERLRELDAKEAAGERPGGRKRSARQVAAERAREEERLHAERALQDVYRQLARAHHPDREQDAGERARKTELMREVNVAYEAKDLLRLLELQLELEAVDAGAVGALADERLRRYNLILEAQAAELARELEELTLPFCVELELEPGARLTPDAVLARIADDTAAVEARIAAVTEDLARLQDIGRLRTWLRAERRADAREREYADRLGIGDLFA